MNLLSSAPDHLFVEESFHVIIAAAGLGSRMKSEVPKQFIMLAGKPIIVHTIQTIHSAWPLAQFIVVLSEDEISRWEKVRKKFLKKTPIQTTKGGATRFHSVKNGLKLIKDDGWVAVQDACRPFLSKAMLLRCLKTMKEKGTAIPSIELNDSIRELKKSGSHHRDRNNFRSVQTPQCFRVALLKKAYQQGFSKVFTDDASVAETAGIKIHIVKGDVRNIKITTPLDMALAEKLSAGMFEAS